MMLSDLKNALSLFIIFLVVIILVVIIVTICRRAIAFRRYRILDLRREEFGGKIRDMLEKKKKLEVFSIFSFPQNSLEWQAVEYTLFALVEEGKYEEAGVALYERLGYRLHYEKMLKKRNIIERSAAAEKLGRMRCKASVDKLINLLDEENPEVASVALRALSKIGTPTALRAVLEQIPVLYARFLVTRKSIEQALLNLGPSAVPEMVRVGERYGDPIAKAFVLEVLGDLKSVEALPLALRCLEHPTPEVRSKALKVIAAVGGGLSSDEKEKVQSMLKDPVWFVRLKAAQAIGALRYCTDPALLEERLVDEKWQVRNAAAIAVVMAASNPAEVFLETLSASDRYAKDSICEEIQKTGFVYRLIENLDPPGTNIYETSRKILSIMALLGYGTPLREYIRDNADSKIAKELASIVPDDEIGVA